MEKIEEFLKGRLPCSTLEMELIEFSKSQSKEIAELKEENELLQLTQISNKESHLFISAILYK